MTASQCRSTCLRGAFVGLVAALILRSVLMVIGIKPPWFGELAVAAGAGLLCLTCRLIHERIVMKDYDKLVEARRRRMHW